MTTASVLHVVNEMASPVFQAQQMIVTPALASRWLEDMPRNRHLNPRDVERYARDMIRGEWRDTGEAIKFDAFGHVIDGQHRLHAIVMANTSLTLLIVRGLAPSAQDVMDTGRKRTAADAFQLNGYKHNVMLAAGGKLALLYERGDFRTATQAGMATVTNSEILAFALDNAELVAATETVSALQHRLPTRPAVSLFTYFETSRIDARASGEFFSDLANMRTAGSGDPKYTLLRRLQNARQANERLSAIMESHFVFRTWNAVRAGKSLANLKASNAHGSFDFARPQ